MKFVEEIVARVIWIGKVRQLGSQCFDLFITKQADAGEIAVDVKEFNLVAGEAVSCPLFDSPGRYKEITDRTMAVG